MLDLIVELGLISVVWLGLGLLLLSEKEPIVRHCLDSHAAR